MGDGDCLREAEFLREHLCSAPGATTAASTGRSTTPAMISIATCEESRRFIDRKRAEGKKHTQAVLALARHRVNVLCAL